MKLSSRENLLPTQKWLLSQGEDFLNNRLAQLLINRNRQRKMEMRDKVISSVGEQNVDTSGQQVSNLRDIEFLWEDPDLNIDAVFSQAMVDPFPFSFFKFSERASMAEETVLVEKEPDKEKLFPPPAIPVSERPTRLLVLLRSCPFGTRTENVPDYILPNFVWTLYIIVTVYVFW